MSTIPCIISVLMGLSPVGHVVDGFGKQWSIFAIK
jgi:hypothetical protein